MADVQFDFVDASRGFAFLSGNLAKGRNDSDLFWTADGGATWSADRPTGDGSVGNEGDIGFATADDGVIVNVAHGTGVVVTHDGGKMWMDATLTPPTGPGAEAFFGRPTFFGARSGLVIVDSQADTGSAWRVYDSSDAGLSWTAAPTLPSGVATVAFLDREHWIGATGTGLFTTTDAGGSWTSQPAVGLPAAPESLEMADAEHGWAFVGMAVCLDFKANCSARTGLYGTSDGGATWVELLPELTT
jgi:photosystem II stability/assembly factor-like uncharacterized protein